MVLTVFDSFEAFYKVGFEPSLYICSMKDFRLAPYKTFWCVLLLLLVCARVPIVPWGPLLCTCCGSSVFFPIRMRSSDDIDPGGYWVYSNTSGEVSIKNISGIPFTQASRKVVFRRTFLICEVCILFSANNNFCPPPPLKIVGFTFFEKIQN